MLLNLSGARICKRRVKFLALWHFVIESLRLEKASMIFNVRFKIGMTSGRNRNDGYKQFSFQHMGLACALLSCNMIRALFSYFTVVWRL